jgi:hypothetical protein
MKILRSAGATSAWVAIPVVDLVLAIPDYLLVNIYIIPVYQCKQYFIYSASC